MYRTSRYGCEAPEQRILTGFGDTLWAVAQHWGYAPCQEAAGRLRMTGTPELRNQMMKGGCVEIVFWTGCHPGKAFERRPRIIGNRPHLAAIRCWEAECAECIDRCDEIGFAQPDQVASQRFKCRWRGMERQGMVHR
jgi:hypothetical protein